MRFTAFVVFLCFSINVNSQFLVSADYVTSLTQAELDVLMFITPEFGIDVYKLTYNTTDVNGNPIIATGLLSIPDSDDCYGFPFSVYMHGTTLNKLNVPSQNNSESTIARFIGGLGYYSCAPDYIGMGDSPGLHPYLHAETEATAGVDMVRAAREYIATQGLVDNEEVFITGYSQGGHAAMAMHKYIEDNALLSEFNVIASAPGSGPYNLSGSTIDDILSGNPYSNPGYLVYVMSSYELAYGNIYNTYSDVLQSPYDGVVVPYFDGNNTTLDMTSLNNQLTPVVTDLLDPTFYTAVETDMSHPLRVALEANDNHDWAPIRPIRMHYCDADEQVAFQNTEVAQANFVANGSTSTEAVLFTGLNHANCFLPSMLGAMNYFASLKSDCTVGIHERTIDLTFSFDETASNLTLTTTEPMKSLRVFDSIGKQVASRDVAHLLQYTESVSRLTAGIYHVEVITIDGKRGLGSFVRP